MIKKNLLHSIVLLLGVSISAILVIRFPNFYHHGDVEAFIRWGALWNKGWTEIYETCTGCNYPILGLFSTAGVFKVLHRIGISNPIQAFRLLLAAVDGINVLLIFFLLKRFSIKNAALWAGIIGLSASSWAGGALWGQIDGISQLFILLTLSWMAVFNLSKKIPPAVYLAVASLLLACLLLTKQLIIFSFVALELSLIVNIFIGRKPLAAAGYLLLHLVFLLAFVFVWDLFLNLDGPYVSHLQLVWGARSETASTLSLNGFSLWIFLNRSMWSSSSIPLLPASSAPWAAWLTPQNIGFLLFFLLTAAAAAVTLLRLRRRGADRTGFLDREDLLRLILLLALVNLIFNVVMTGTHERYLFHFYPFLLVACLGLEEFQGRFSAALRIFILAGANLYGWFVLRVLWGDISYRYTMHRFVALYHLLLLAVLFLLAAVRGRDRKARASAGASGPVPADSASGG